MNRRNKDEEGKTVIKNEGLVYEHTCINRLHVKDGSKLFGCHDKK